MVLTSVPKPAAELVDFLNSSWTQFHATEEVCKKLTAAGFQQLSEKESWDLKPGGKYFYTRNMSSVVAFALGGKFKAGNGFNVVAAHTDSPCPKLKPVSKTSGSGCLKVGVQTYGGGLWHTWFDRDLSVAGRVLVRRDGGKRVSHDLVRVDRPIMRIPTLAIHLDRTVNTDGFKPNLETHLAPVLATSIKDTLAYPQKAAEGAEESAGTHHAALLDILAAQLACAPEDIVDFELNVCDTQPSAVGGAHNEFIYSGRLDNLCMSFCAAEALLESLREAPGALAEETNGWMIALFDHEEVGSGSTAGAASPIMFEAVSRCTKACAQAEEEGIVERCIRNSFMVSADMAHALHPNHPGKHEECHQPKMHKGIVIKHNANQRYATNSVTNFLFRECAVRRSIPMQDFCVRNDMGCGSTIGPIVAAGTGMRVIDVGVPQLSMHSVREMCGCDDVGTAIAHFRAFFEEFTSVDQMIEVDK